MTRKEVTEILERVRSWPQQQQAELAQIALELEQQATRSAALTDAQAEAVRRIRADVRAGAVASDEEMAALWKQCGL